VEGIYTEYIGYVSDFKMAKQQEDSGGEGWVRRPFPKHTLEQALVVVNAIQDKNAGKPMRRLFVADAIGRKPSSSEFKYLLSSSFKYGLTEGTEKSEHIDFTPLGQSIAKPRSPEERIAKLQEAALKPDLFKRAYDHYNNSKWPTDGPFFRNVLERDFGVPSEWTDDCVKVLNENGRFSGIVRDVAGSPHVILGDYTSAAISVESQEEAVFAEKLPGLSVTEKAPPPTPTISRVFISHSKNVKILGQLKQMLKFGGFDAEIAQERETTAIPIPEKIFNGMRKCDCAVINVSADEQEKRDGENYGINQNVLIEIGGAFLLYDRKVILLVDRRIKLPSNLQGLSILYYDGDELSWDTGMRLQEALTGFRSTL